MERRAGDKQIAWVLHKVSLIIWRDKKEVSFGIFKEFKTSLGLWLGLGHGLIILSVQRSERSLEYQICKAFQMVFCHHFEIGVKMSFMHETKNSTSNKNRNRNKKSNKKLTIKKRKLCYQITTGWSNKNFFPLSWRKVSSMNQPCSQATSFLILEVFMGHSVVWEYCEWVREQPLAIGSELANHIWNWRRKKTDMLACKIWKSQGRLTQNRVYFIDPRCPLDDVGRQRIFLWKLDQWLRPYDESVFYLKNMIETSLPTLLCLRINFISDAPQPWFQVRYEEIHE